MSGKKRDWGPLKAPIRAVQDFMKELKAAVREEKAKKLDPTLEEMLHPESRPMKFAYTISAKIAQFPYRAYYTKSWFFRYWIFGSIVALPLFMKIEKMSYSPANVEKWNAIRERDFTPGPHEDHH